jgi:hypothetical protein
MTTDQNISFGCNATTIETTNITSIVLNVTGTANWTQTISSLNTNNYNASFVNSTIALGSYSWRCIAYGSNGLNATSSTWVLVRNAMLENSQTYNNATTELTSETFTINITYDPVTYPFAIANLVYNGTSYLGTNNGNGIFTRTIDVPSVSANTNISFYWNFVFGTTITNSTFHNQTVNNFGIDDCSAYTNLLYNFTIRDEATRQTYPYINGTFNIDLYLSTMGTENRAISYNKNFNSTESKLVCANINFSSYRVDMVGDYQATGYVQKFYYIDNGTLVDSLTPYNIDLHDLLLTDSTTFLFHYTDQNGLTVPNAVVLVYRDYIGEGIFREVERAKTDDNGETHVHLVEEDVIYYFVVTKDSKILFTSATYNAKCLSTPCEISLSASPSDINWSVIDNEGGQYSVSTNKATRIVTTTFYLDSSDLVNVSLYRFYNGASELINSSSLTAQAGSISLHVPLSYNNATFFVAIYRGNRFIKSEWIDLTESGINYFGTFGAILGGLILIAIMLMAVSEGAGFIIFTSLALVIMVVMQIVDLGWLAVISLVCAGGVIVWKLISRRNKQG